MIQVAKMSLGEIVCLLIKDGYKEVAERETMREYSAAEIKEGEPEREATHWLCDLAPRILNAAKENELKWLPHGIYIGTGKTVFALLKGDFEANGWACCL